MKQRQSNNTGVRLSAAQRAKLDQLADTLNTSRNRIFGMLLDAAEVQAPSAKVELKSNRHDAQNLTRQSITAIGA